ncbi:uncharacterized protein LOC142229399 [Haematobia irritans]|uniref:uncharacterized protein LOC142229399 n=2 Tax=Haematobia irritans TaxID=7368 RepID=UPI003F4F734A
MNQRPMDNIGPSPGKVNHGLSIAMASCFFNERYACPICGRWHAIRDCTRFLVLDPARRRDRALSDNLCTSCLAQSHQRRDCPGSSKCQLCNRGHNSLLHPIGPNSCWFPMTAMCRIYPTGEGWSRLVRVVVDPNVTHSCISLDAAEDLGCRILKGYTKVTLRHRIFDRDPVDLRCAVEDTQYGETPKARIDDSWITHHPVVGRAHLADPNWSTPRPYMVIVGADAIPVVLKGAAISPPGKCCIQFSVFGPLLFGEGLRIDPAKAKTSTGRQMEKSAVQRL